MTKRPMPREKRKDSRQQKKIVAAEITEAIVHGEAAVPPEPARKTKAPVKASLKSPQGNSSTAKPLAARPLTAKASTAKAPTAKASTAKLTVPKPPAPKAAAPKATAPRRAAETPAARTLAAKTPLSETPAAKALVSAAAPDERAAPAPLLLESTVESFQSSLQAAGKGAVAVNCKLLDIAQENVNSGLELVRDMAGATTPLEVLRLQMSYLQACMQALEGHAKDLRALSADLVASTSKPLREHLRK